MTGTPATVEVDDVHVHYTVFEDETLGLKKLVSEGRIRRQAQRIHAVRGVSFSILQGETVGIIGSNGSGKSTLLSAMTGLLPITSGDIRVRSRPALLGVSAALRASLSGRRNILIGCLALGMTPAETEQRTDEIIDFAGLRESIDLPMRTYSSGMKARLNFAIATAATPEILLIDEALAVGDEDFRRRSQQRIDEIRGNAGSVVLVSHNLNEIAQGCDRVVWLEQGELRMVGGSDEVVAAYIESQSLMTEEKSEILGPVPSREPIARRSGRRAVLHIGVAGAGDDSIQSVLRKERSAIFRQNMIYPSFIAEEDHRVLARYGSPNVDGGTALPADKWASWADEFAENFRSATDRDGDLVVSSVALGYLDAAAIDRVLKLLDSAGFSTVDVVQFVRRQDEVASIVHRRRVLNGSSAPFDLASHLADEIRYDFSRSADAWAGAIGDEHVHVRLHADRPELTSNLACFAAIAGLEPFSADPVESSAHPAAVAVIRELNRRRGGDPIRPSLDFLLRQLDGAEAPGLNAADAQALLERYADTNRAIFDRIPVSDRRDGYFDAPRLDMAAERDFEREDVLGLLELAVEQMSLLRRTLARQQKEI